MSPYGAQLGAAQNIVKDEHRKKGIGTYFKTQTVPFRFLRIGANTCEAAQIEIHYDRSTPDDDSFPESRSVLPGFPL